MNRSEIREEVFKLIFQADFYPKSDIESQVDFYLDESDELLADKDHLLVRTRFESVFSHISEIDALLNEKTSGWTTGRMGKTELAILRLAVYEIKFDDDIPTAVAINEAVELAKKYSGEDAASFVNGVLAHFA